MALNPIFRRRILYSTPRIQLHIMFSFSKFVNFLLFFNAECVSPAPEEIPVNVSHVALVPMQTSSPERRITQKEIIAGEERPKYLLIKQHQDAAATGNFYADLFTARF